tara:strand:- start:441 stop:1355 length:915 start_codon:yes stop_codon:yes gene_type:complete
MNKLTLSFLFILVIGFSSLLKSDEVKIITKIDKEIITNIDVEKEYKYLISLNKDYQKLEKDKIFKFVKSSLLREKIKEIELRKYFKLGIRDDFLNNRIGELYKKRGFLSADDFQNYLKNFDLKIEDVAKKIEIELKWNKLIYDKYKNQIVINEDILRKKIINESQNKNMYNLSELIFSIENKEKINEVTKSIKEIGFEKTVLIYSKVDSRQKSGNLGWINELSLSKSILEELKKTNISEVTNPIQIQNGVLILRLNDKKKADISSINIEDNLRELIKFETNKQLNVFSGIHFEKIKDKLNIYEY